MNQLSLSNQQTVDEISLIYKSKTPPSQRVKITGSQDAYNAFRTTWNQDTIELHEEFKVMLLSRSNRVLGVTLISIGGTSGTVVDLRLILASALTANASSVICGHNHPSGNLKPSEADQKITQKISAAAKLMDISLLDHLILVPGNSYFSFSDEGIL